MQNPRPDRKSSKKRGGRRWSARVTKRSALSMLTFCINRAGKNLPASRKRTLQKAKGELKKAFGKD